jgi:hypothetical protein
MDKIIDKYYLLPNSTLAKYNFGTNGVDCWFDTNKDRQHRCLSFEDFKLISNAWMNVKYVEPGVTGGC